MYAYRYKWKGGTPTNADPGSGRIHSETTGYITDPNYICISRFNWDADGIQNVLDLIRNSGMRFPGVVKIALESDATKYIIGTMQSVTKPGANYYRFYYNHLQGTQPYDFADDVFVTVEFMYGWQTIGAQPEQGVTLWNTNGFRLTLESGAPDDTVDRTGKTTIYWSPFISDAIALYDGSSWNIRNVSQLSISLGTLTANKNYDVFVYDDAGTPTLELGPAWTNDTTRYADITRLNGVWVKAGGGANSTRRYVGSFRTTSTTTTENSNVKRFLYNVDNQLPTPMWSSTGPFGHSYNSATFQKLNGTDADSTVLCLIGVSNRSMLSGDIGVHGYSGDGGDAHIGLSITTNGAVTTQTPPNTSLVQSTAPISSRVMARQVRLDQGVNYLTIIEYCFTSGVTNSYQYGNHNLSVLM